MGTSFFVDLPLTEWKEPRAPLARRGFARVDRPLNILVVDDVEDNRLLVQLYLRNLPYRLTFARDGEEALRKHRATRFDLILMDMHMPKMNGYETTMQIRNEEKRAATPYTPIIVLTANALQEQTEKCLLAGCDRHLTKPINREALQRTISDVMNQHEGFEGEDAPLDSVVYVRQTLSELVPDFLEKRRADFLRCGTALSEHNYDEIAKLGSSLKGICGSFGFEELSNIGREIHRAAQIRDDSRVKSLYLSAIERLGKLEVRYF